MDIVSILFVLGICVMGGAIAYGADLLGRHIGKKRLKLFSWLRPKYTAAVLAALAGFFIPLITVGIVYALSRDVRVWLTEGRQAVAQRDLAIKQRDQMTKEAKEKANEVESLTSQSKIAQLNLQLSNDKVKDLKANIGKLQDQAAKLGESVRKAQAQLAEARRTYQSLRRQYDALQPEYKLAIQTRDEAIKQRNEAHKELDRLNGELAAKDKEIKDRQLRLDTLTNDFKAFQKLSDDKIADQNRLLADGAKKLESLQSDIEARKLELDRVQSELDALKRSFSSLQQGFGSGRANPMIFAKSDELARSVIPASASEGEVRSILMSAVRTARMLASSRGAVDPGGGEATAGLFNADHDTLDAVKKGSGSKEPMVLILQSYWNAFKGESVPLVVAVLPNPVIYPAEKIIAETEIDGRATDDSIIGQINDFVAKTLGPKAVRDGMIPAIGQEQTLGEIKRETVLALEKEIRDSKRVVRLVALAAKETRAADRLEIEFKLR